MKQIASLSIILFILSGLASAVLEIPAGYRDVRPGQNLWFSTGEITGKMTAEILSPDGKVIAYREYDESEQGGLSILVPTTAKPGLYMLRLKSGAEIFGEEFNVTELPGFHRSVIERSLFDIIVDIPNAYRNIEPGGQLLSTTKLLNLGSEGRIDVFMDYWITSSDGAIVTRKKETVAVETQANFVKIFDLPAAAKPGAYCLHSRITYADGKMAAAEGCFNIVQKKAFSPILLYLLGGILAAAGLLALFIIQRPRLAEYALRSRVRAIIRKKFR